MARPLRVDRQFRILKIGRGSSCVWRAVQKRLTGEVPYSLTFQMIFEC